MKLTNYLGSTEKIFTDIYSKNKWGGDDGSYYSGSGSYDSSIVNPYVNLIKQKALDDGFFGTRFVDLGCGDFQVGKQFQKIYSKYIGVDVVEPLIKFNQQKYKDDSNIDFVCLDIVKDNLPDGDVCFVRQVLQHLSNKQILNVLPKLKKYKWVFITEHLPENATIITPNLDKVCGPDIRLEKNSGVYLTEPPFYVPTEKINKVLEVSLNKNNSYQDQGRIVTFLYKP
jgi:SAM-dependent methyltransferase